MKLTYFAVASVTLIMLSVPAIQAAPKANTSPTAQARVMLAQVDSLSASIADTADRLSLQARGQDDAQSDVSALDLIKDDVNKIGRDLQFLESEQAELDQWESRAVGEVLPLMHEVAENTEMAIKIFQSNRGHLWTTSFTEETAKVSVEAERVKGLIDGQLKLAALREQEQRLEESTELSR